MTKAQHSTFKYVIVWNATENESELQPHRNSVHGPLIIKVTCYVVTEKSKHRSLIIWKVSRSSAQAFSCCTQFFLFTHAGCSQNEGIIYPSNTSNTRRKFEPLIVFTLAKDLKPVFTVADVFWVIKHKTLSKNSLLFAKIYRVRLL